MVGFMGSQPENDTLAVGQWPKVASTWKQVGSPLRPVDEDLVFFCKALQDWCKDHHGKLPRGLILGVTPELYYLPWPDRALLKAVDRTPEMIRYVWPGSPEDVVMADWRELDLPDAGMDIVMCDGGLHLLDYPAGQLQLINHLRQLIAPGGLLVLRLFVPPAMQESPAAVLAALMEGRIPNLNCLKLRLGMALQETASAGVPLRKVWDTLRSISLDWSDLAGKLGWTLEHLQVIDAYRDSGASYYFVGQDQAVAMICESAFELRAVEVPSYEMGAQCPTLVFRRL